MPIAELFLSSVVKTLLNRLGDVLLAEYARINGISDKLKKWGITLRMIQAVMDSAEERQMDGDPVVDHWLSELREVTYDMEDLLDEFSVEAKRNSNKAQARSSKLPSCLPACCSRIDPRMLISDRHLAGEIEEVDRRLDDVFLQKDRLKLVENSKSRSAYSSGQTRFAATSLPEPKFVGREKEMDELLVRLTRNDATDDYCRPFTVVSIVGMGGVGKTTLAQELYHHKSLCFELTAWSCISDVFDRVAITKSVLDQVAPSTNNDGKDLNWLQTSLKEKLLGKKFLIALDDVWNDNYDELESLLKPFYSGCSGSKIFLTTRNKEVARLVGDPHPMELDLLPLEECLSLLTHHSIGKENFEHHPHLEDIAVQLAKKCMGLPLAVKTIGGLLRFESNDEKWKQLLAHGIWERLDGHGKVPPALKLSYIHLPIHLKRCFVACALFPKDYSFDRDELIRLWIVHGLLDKGTTKTYGEVGLGNLSQLEARSLLQKTREMETRYSMHDLINDLAKSVVGDTYFSSDEYKGSSGEGSLVKVRHAAVVTQSYEMCLLRRFDLYRPMKKLRTFMPFNISRELFQAVFVADKVIHDLIMNWKHLRMLSLCYFQIKKVPDQIGELKLLRSINFSFTEIEALPDSVCDLIELKTLLVRGCRRLKKLPEKIHKLTNLLHLDILATINLKEMPPRIGELINLEILSTFVVGKEASRDLKQLGPLKCLQQELHIRELMEVNNVEDARIANLCEKEGVLNLTLDWGSNARISRDDEHQLKLLDYLQPSGKIECLSIYQYGGKKFVSWFSKPCMNKVVSISLMRCESVELLPPFGQLPSLEKLVLKGLGAISTIGEEFYGNKMPFRVLRKLSFENMQAWEEWLSCGDCENVQPFPCLKELTLIECPKLKGGLPGRLDSVVKLEIKDCPLLETSGDTLNLPSLSEMCIESCNVELLKCLVAVTSMTKMSIRNVPQLVHFDWRFSTSWIALEEMTIVDCPRFTPFIDEDGAVQQVPPKLTNLVIKNCEGIEKLPDNLFGLTSLNVMTIGKCRKLSSFPSLGFPAALRKLKVKDCPSLPQSQLINTRLPESLEELTLSNLEALVSIADIGVDTRFYRSLWKLLIRECGGFTAFSDSLQHLSALSELTVWGCQALEVDCFPALPCNLSIFSLFGCPKVKSLPQDMQNLTSLHTIWISSCDGITSISRGGGLPPNLESLNIEECRNLNQPLEEWGLRGLTALRVLILEGEMGCMDEMACFPPTSSSTTGYVDAWCRLLPVSLLVLQIPDTKKLKRLAPGLRDQLSSLKQLHIRNCPKMRWLPGDGLPDSLEWLSIIGCPLLEKRCSEPNGDYWPLVQLIPAIKNLLDD